MLAVLLHPLEHLRGLGRQLAVEAVLHQLGVAEDGVERRAQLVAHVGQELRLVLARHLELRGSSARSRWNRRALWMASADCVAKVCSRLTVSGANAPGLRRRTISAPIARPWCSSGTASSALKPARCRTSNSGYARRLGRVRDLHGLAAARRIRRRPSRRGGSGARAPRPDAPRVMLWPASSTNSPRRLVEHVDGAAAGVRQLAGMAEDGVEHRLQVERGVDGLADLPSAFSSATDRDSSAVRACTSSNSRAFSMAITAWSAKVSTSSICLSVNGRTSVRGRRDGHRRAPLAAAAGRASMRAIAG